MLFISRDVAHGSPINGGILKWSTTTKATKGKRLTAVGQALVTAEKLRTERQHASTIQAINRIAGKVA